MALIGEGIAAFLEAVGIAAVLWVLFDWIMRPTDRFRLSVWIPLSGDASGLEALLRRLNGLDIVLLDEGLSAAGRRRAEQAARERPYITLKKQEETHGGAQHD